MDELDAFVEKQANIKVLRINIEEKRSIIEKCMNVLNDQGGKENHLTALTSLKILSRDKNDLDNLITAEIIDAILRQASIIDPKEVLEINEDEGKVIEEAQRCLNNLLLQSGVVRALCSKNQTLAGITNLVMTWKPDRDIVVRFLTVDLKILFLITALCPDTRKVVYVDHRGLSRLLNFLYLIISDAKEMWYQMKTESPTLTLDKADLAGEALKVLFNITLSLEDKVLDEEEQLLMDQLCQILHSLLTIDVEGGDEARLNLTSNCVNLLSNVSVKSTSALLAPLEKDVVSRNAKEIEYDGSCMNCIRAMLDLLLANTENEAKLREGTTPVLSVLCTLSRHHRSIRKYLRAEVLPPLRDLNQRPEVGEKARNKLCKLLTSPIDAVSSLVAEFLFILCKESVARMVKYTGYGNAAGLLARRGLMLGGKGSDAAIYSDEEDSETEEYSENAHKVNPIVGCVQPNHPSPFEGMSEEQKEYEAMKLVNLINDLQNVGIMKPAMPGADGTPVEMNHVLQMREAAEALRSTTQGSTEPNQDESDSD